VTAPAARTLAEIVAEGRRLERPNEPGPKGQRAVFWAEHASLFLAVAEAAVEWEAADAEQRRVPAWSRDTDLFERMLCRGLSATRALRAAVRGEEKTK
jgi:hypothetical protein